MNEETFFELLSTIIRNYSLSVSGITIVGGGASLIHGLRTHTNDVDVLINAENFDRLFLKGCKHITLPAMGKLGPCDGFEVEREIFILQTDMLNYSTMRYRGFNVLDKEGLLRYRTDLGRSKDQSDITKLVEENRIRTGAYFSTSPI